MGLKRMEVKKETIGQNTFGIRRFGAFKASNLSGELVAMFAPVLTAFVPVIVGEVKADKESGESKSIMDEKVEDLAPAIVGAFKTLKGDSVEKILKKLLIEDGNIAVQTEENPEGEILTAELADDIFCGDVQDMFLLAAKVIMVNYERFFEKMRSPSGQVNVKAMAKALMQ